MIGWRINTVTPHGAIAGFPPHRYPWTPPATCINGHTAPHLHCGCGHHITRDLDKLLGYSERADTIAPARTWGTYADTRTRPDDGTARVLVQAVAAGTIHRGRSWDPSTTVRAARIRLLAVYLDTDAEHLAEPIRRTYPHLIDLHVVDDWAEILISLVM
ncbi:hypothetical protein [Rhodococcus ruber]